MPRPYRHRATLFAFVAILLFCGAQLYTRHLDRAAESAYVGPFIVQFRADDQAVQSVSAILSNYRLSHNGDDIPYTELETLLFKTGTIDHAFYYTDSATGGRVHLSVRDGRCFLVGNVGRSIPPRPPFLPYELLTFVRRLLYIAGYSIWAFLLIAYLSTPSPRRSPNTVHVMLLVAIASTLLASVSIHPTFTPLADEGAPLAGVLIATFTLPLFLLRSRPRPDHPTCPTCSYNLTGNLSQACPECGTPTPLAPDTLH